MWKRREVRLFHSFLFFKQTNVKKRRHDGDTLNPERRKEEKEEAEDEEEARDLNFKARRRKYVTFPQKHTEKGSKMHEYTVKEL